MKPGETQLHVDRLVLRGFSTLDAQRVRDAFVAALAEPWTPGLPPSPARDALRLTVTDRRDPEALGRDAARALREALRS